ncbi:MAG: hypothetical protein ACOX9R_16680 [Armatimonadota bacterium]|jgi:hypothetical protein
MIFREDMRFRLRTGLVVASLLMAAHVPSDGSCAIRTARPAASFLVGEPVEFTIISDLPAQRVAWSVTDYYGEECARGVMRAGAGSTTLRVTPRPGVGYYTLALQYESGDGHEKVFCVLPHPDEDRGDGGLFGLGITTTSEMLWDAAWQIGARHFRAELPWTEVERVQGEHDLERVRRVAELARERDMQLTVLTGHTPRHYGVRPVDAQGRVAEAWHTWQPEGTVEWYEYIDAMARTLAPLRLSPERARGSDSLSRSGRPLVLAWEVWSEADQNFYYGSWNRYLDMLRITHNTVRRRARIPIVYGSTGHMTELQWTLLAGCGEYFDRVAFHPYHEDPGWMMMHWYRNMPQKLVVWGAMRETALTECGFHSPEAGGEAGFMPRVYATLKAFGEDLFIRSSCLGAVFTPNRRDYSLAHMVDGELEPLPAYVAFAVTRWLLESAAYVGPLEAPEGAQMELFLRRGTPMVIGWTTGGARAVEVDVASGAVMMDALGKRTSLAGPSARIELSTDAVAILGVSWETFAEAVKAGLELALATELGHVSPFDSPWIDPLEVDLARCVDPGFPDELREALASACDRALSRPPHGPAAFFEVQRLVGDAMLQVVAQARERDELTRAHSNTLWRLVRLTEALGRVADSLGERWPRMNNVTSEDMQRTLEMISQNRSRVAASTGGAESPLAHRLQDRALDGLDRVRQGGGHARGRWWAATLTARVAHALTAIEPARMRAVFVTGEFPTADAITKGVLLRPGSGHRVEARVFNFLPEGLSGRVQAGMPDGWGGMAPGGPFIAPAGGPSEPVELTFSVPGRPTPWVERELPRVEWHPMSVDAPPTAELSAELALSGQGGSAGPAEMTYRVYVGAYPSETQRAADPVVSIHPINPPRGDDVLVWITGAPLVAGGR